MASAMNYIEAQMRSKKIWLIVSALIGLIFAGVLQYFWWRTELRWREVQKWERVPATVMEHRIVQTGTGKSRRRVSELVYRYTVDKKICFGTDCGVGGQTLLPRAYRKKGAVIACYIHPQTRESVLAYYDRNVLAHCLPLAFFCVLALCCLAQVLKLKKQDARTVPPEFAARLSPVPEMSGKALRAKQCLIYQKADFEKASPGVLFLPKPDVGRWLVVLYLLATTLAFLAVAILERNGRLLLVLLPNICILYILFRPGKVFFLDPAAKIFYFTRRSQVGKLPEAFFPFSEVQGMYLVWLNSSDCMGLLIRTAGSSIILGNRDWQQLMRDAVTLANWFGPDVPMYDLIHREFDRKQRQGYVFR